MKKYFVFLLIMFPFFVSAQGNITDKCPLLNQVKSFSFTDANKFADEVLLDKSKNLFKENFSMGTKYSINYYPDDYERRKTSVRFDFVKVKEGENKAAGMAGKPVYKLLDITGNWENIYSIWNELMQCTGNPVEEREFIEKTKRSTFVAINADGKKVKFYLQKIAIDWKIDVTEER